MKRISVTILLLLCLLALVACSTPPSEGEHPPSVDSNTPNLEDTAPEENGDIEDTKPPIDENESKPEEEVKPPPKPIVEYDTIAITTATKVNIRSGPSKSSHIIGTLKRGEGLAVIDTNISGYVKVHYKRKEAYIYGSYLHIEKIEKSRSQTIERVIYEGKRLMGYPYVWGSQRYHWGNGIVNKNFVMGEFDCSSLMQYMMYHGARINIDVTTRSQVYQGRLVTGNIERGDLMFFTNSARRHKKGVERVGHVAMYLGDNYILHTAEGYAVIEAISNARWSNYLVSKRFIHI